MSEQNHYSEQTDVTLTPEGPRLRPWPFTEREPGEWRKLPLPHLCPHISGCIEDNWPHLHTVAHFRMGRGNLRCKSYTPENATARTFWSVLASMVTTLMSQESTEFVHSIKGWTICSLPQTFTNFALADHFHVKKKNEMLRIFTRGRPVWHSMWVVQTHLISKAG